MKTKMFLSLAVTAAVCFLQGCATMSNSQKVALAGAEAGNAYATFELQKSGAAAVKALTDLAVELPNIPLGKVSAFQIGALQAELQVAKANLATNPTAENQIISLASLVANNQGTLTSGIVTGEQALVFGAFQNVATGIANAVQVYLGQQSILHPSAPTSSILPYEIYPARI